MIKKPQKRRLRPGLGCNAIRRKEEKKEFLLFLVLTL
jgi:hypothetical protein